VTHININLWKTSVLRAKAPKIEAKDQHTMWSFCGRDSKPHPHELGVRESAVKILY